MSEDSAALPLPAETIEAASSGRRSVARNTSALFISQALGWLVALPTMALLPRYLGPEAVGQLRLAAAVWAIGAVFFSFGLNSVVTVELARDSSNKRVLGRAIGLQLVLFVITFAAVIGFMLIADYDRAVVIVTIIMGLVTAYSCLAGPAQAAFYGLEQMAKPATAEVINKFVSAGLLVGVLVAGFGINVVAFVPISGAIIGAIVVLPALIRLVGRDALVPRLHDNRQLLREGWPFLMNDATLALYLQVDTVIISLLATQTEIGWYSTADTIYGALLFVPTILMTSLFPVLARLGHQDVAELDRLVQRSFGFLMLMAVPMGLGTLAIAKPVCRLAFGDKFVESGPVLGVYGIVLLLGFPTILLGRVALATGRQRFWARLMILATAASIPADLVLVPWTHDRYGNGAIGGALSYIVTESIIVLAALKWVAPEIVSKAVGKRMLKVALCGAAMFAVAWPLRNQFLAIPIVAAAVVYVAGVAVTRALDEEEVAMVRRIVSKLTGGRVIGDKA